MLYDSEVKAAIAKWASYYGVRIDSALVHAIIQRESSHGAQLVVLEPDGDHSYGPMMVKASTASSQLGVENPASLKDPALGIWYGVKYLAWQLKRYGGKVESAIAAYNAGSAHLSGGRYTNQPYVDAVLRWWTVYRGAVTVGVPALAIAALVFFLARRRARA